MGSRSNSVWFIALLAASLCRLSAGASLTWVGANSGGVWGLSTNWNTNSIPTASDDVTFPSTVTAVTVNTPSVANSITTTGATVITYAAVATSASVGTITLATSSQITYSPTANPMIVGTLYMQATSGRFNVDANAKAQIDSVYLLGSTNFIQIASTGQMIVNRFFEWGGTNNRVADTSNAATAVFQLGSNCTSVFDGTGTTQYLSAVMNNYGTLTYSMAFNNGIKTWGTAAKPGVIRNYGTFSIANVINAGIQFYYTSNVENYGTWVVNVTGDVTQTNPFMNYGTTSIVSGIFRLSNGGTFYANSALWSTDSGSLSLEGGTTALNAAATINETTSVTLLNAAIFNVMGNFLPTSFTLTGTSTINFQQMNVLSFPTIIQNSATTITFQGAPVYVGTYQLGAGTGRVFGGVSLVIDSLYLSGSTSQLFLDSNPAPGATVNITTYFEWAGSNCRLSDTNNLGKGQFNILANATASLIGTGTSMYMQPTFNNWGVLTYSAAATVGMKTYNGGNWRNYNMWIIDNVLNGAMVCQTCNAANAFYNYGTVVARPVYDFIWGTMLENYGNFTVDNGLMRVTAGGDQYQGSTFQNSPSGTLRFETGTFTQQAGTFLDTPGFVFLSGTVTFNGDFLPTTFTMSGGILNFQQMYGQYTWGDIVQTAGTVNFVAGRGIVATINSYSVAGTLSFGSGVRATIGTLIMSAASAAVAVVSQVAPNAAAFVNITDYFEWSGTAAQLTDSASTAYGSYFTINRGARALISGTGNLYLTPTFANYGTVTLSAPTVNAGLRLNQYGCVLNYGTFNVIGTSTYMIGGATKYNNWFYNWGLLQVNTTTDFSMDASLENHGVVTSIAGTFRMKAGGNLNAGSAISTDGGFISFEAGTLNHNVGATFSSGSGFIFAGTSTNNMYGDLTVETFSVSGTTTVTFYQVYQQYSFPSLSQNGGTVWFRNALGSVYIGVLQLTGASKFGMDSGCAGTIDYLYLTGSGASIDLSSNNAPSTLNVTQYFEWTGSQNTLLDSTSKGTGLFTINQNATAYIAGTGNNQYQLVTFINYGTVNYNAAPAYGIRLNVWGSFQNFGNWIVGGNQAAMQSYTAPNNNNFFNWGTLTVNVTVDFITTVAIQQSGIVNVISGIFRPQSGGTSQPGAIWQHSDGTHIQFEAGTFNFLPQSRVETGNGIRFNGGTVLMSGTFVPTYFEVSAGSVTFQEPGTEFSFPAVSQTGGQVWFKSPGGAVSVGTYTLQGSSALVGVAAGINMVVDYLYLIGSSCTVSITTSTPTSMVNVTTYFEWSGTQNSLQDTTTQSNGLLNILPTATALITGTGTVQNQAVTIVNYGTVNYNCPMSYGIRNSYYGWVRNYGSWIVGGTQTAMMVQSTNYRNIFQNWGTLTVNVTDYFQVNANLDQRGTVYVLNGILRMMNGGTGVLGSTMSTSPSGTLEFNAGTFTMQAGSTVSAPSLVTFSGGTTQFYGDFLPNTFTLTGAPYVYFSKENQAYSFTSISQTVTANVYFNGASQTLSVDSWSITGGTGSLQLGAGVQASIASLTMASASAYVLLNSGATLNITSNLAWTAASYFQDSTGTGKVIIVEGATATLQGPSATYSLYTNLINYGTLNLAMTGTTSTGLKLQSLGQLNNMASGLMVVSSYLGGNSHTYFTTGGSGTFNNFGTLQVSMTDGYNFLCYPPFNNYGTTDVRHGTFDVRGVSRYMAGSSFTFFSTGYMTLWSSTIYAGSYFKTGSALTFSGAVSALAPLAQNSITITAGTTTVTGGGRVDVFRLTGTASILTIPAGALLLTFGLNYTLGTVNVNAPVAITTMDLSSSTTTVATATFSINNRNTPATIQTLVLGKATAVATLTVNANTVLTIRNLLLQSYGSLSINPNAYVGVTSSFDWYSTASSTIAGAGTLSLQPTCHSVIEGTSTTSSINGVIENSGTLSYRMTGTTGITLLNAASTIRNQYSGVFNVDGTVTAYLQKAASPTFSVQNMGTLNVNQPDGQDFILGAPLNNTGTINVNSGNFKPFSLIQRGGSLTVRSRVYAAPNAGVTSISGWSAGATRLLHTGGYIQGTGQVLGGVTQTGGSIHPGLVLPEGLGTVGRLSIDDLVTSTPNSYIEISFLNSGVASSLNVTGSLSISQSIVKAVPSCPYYPAVGDAYTQVVTWGSRTGEFFAVFGIQGITLAPIYQPKGLDVGVIAIGTGAWACSTSCVHGTCCPTDVCNCDSDWTGLQCDIPLCGNGVRTATEECDDGNTFSGDGCSSSCRIESGWSCNTTAQPSICSAVCGDGMVAATEECDDGNTIPGDGCDDLCQEELGWICEGAGPGSCQAVCGDGVARGTETCDDGNIDSFDGCSSTCQVEFGYICVNATSPNTCASICGDGKVAASEQCDDGNSRVGDGCSFCTIDNGWLCSGTAPSYCWQPLTSGTTIDPNAPVTTAPATTLAHLPVTTGLSNAPPTPPPPPPPLEPPYDWSTAAECKAGDDFAVIYDQVPVYIVSSKTGYCSCLAGFNTPGDAKFGGKVTADKVTVASDVDAKMVDATAINANAVTTNTLQVQSISTTLAYSVQPASRFVSTESSGWFYTGESLHLTVFSPTRYRFHFRQMVGNNATSVGNMAYILSISSSSTSYVPACNTPSAYDFVPAGMWTTTTASWYCTVSSTGYYYMWVNTLSGGSDWAIANENAASRAYSDFHATAS